MKNKIFKFEIKNLIYSLIFAAIVLIFTILSIVWKPFLGLDNAISDSIYQHQGNPAKDIVIVGIDDSTIEEYGAYTPKKYRQYFADVLEMWASNDINPSVIGFDVIFNEAEDCSVVDSNLALAMQKHNVILGVNGASREKEPYGLSSKIYSGAKSIGFVDAKTDSDEAIRMAYLKGNNYNSLSYALYEAYCIKKGISPIDVALGKAYYFKYYAKPTINYTGAGDINDVTSGFNYISLSSLIKETLDPSLDKTTLRPNQMVLFGSYASALDTGLSNDIYNSPIGEMFGVEVQANIIQALMENELYLPSNTLSNAIINTLLVFVIAFSMMSFAFYFSVVSFGLGIGFEFLIMLILYNMHRYYFISLPSLILIVSFIFVIALHYYTEYRHKKEVITTFKRYISPDVAQALVEKDEDAISLGGRKRNVACLFVDIRGFTKMSEELNPEEVVDILNGYLEMATNQVFKYGGMVDKFIGDCVMAIFNAPIDLDDYIFKAVCAAYGIVCEGKEICDMVKEKYDKNLEFGVGVHFGDAVIGNIGSKTRMDFTAIGDTVNTASRIEASAKGHQVLISSDVYDVIKDRVEVLDAGDRMFKNKKEPIKCYEVTKIIGYENFK